MCGGFLALTAPSLALILTATFSVIDGIHHTVNQQFYSMELMV